jgi:hypothetical protein
MFQRIITDEASDLNGHEQFRIAVRLIDNAYVDIRKDFVELAAAKKN